MTDTTRSFYKMIHITTCFDAAGSIFLHGERGFFKRLFVVVGKMNEDIAAVCRKKVKQISSTNESKKLHGINHILDSDVVCLNCM